MPSLRRSPVNRPFCCHPPPHGALHGVVVCKVPDKFSHKPRALVQTLHPDGGRTPPETSSLNISAPAVQPCHGVRTVLAHHHGLVLLWLQKSSSRFRLQRRPCHRKVVPAVVAVDADDIHGAGGDIQLGVSFWQQTRVTRRSCGSSWCASSLQRVPVVVGILREALQIRLVAKAHSTTQGWFLSDGSSRQAHLPVMLRKGVFPYRGSPLPAADAHSPGLVHDQNATRSHRS